MDDNNDTTTTEQTTVDGTMVISLLPPPDSIIYSALRLGLTFQGTNGDNQIWTDYNTGLTLSFAGGVDATEATITDEASKLSRTVNKEDLALADGIETWRSYRISRENR